MIHPKPNEPAKWSGVLSQQCRQWLSAIPLPLEINNSLSLMYIFYTSLELTWLDESGGGAHLHFKLTICFLQKKPELNKKKEMQQVSVPLWRGRHKSREWVK